MSFKFDEKERGRTNPHYNLSPEIFGLILDSSLKYSAGIYLQETDSLEQAQIQKMEFIARELDLKGGEEVLDVGCGWGSLTLFLASRFGCRVTGVTPAKEQASYILKKAEERKLTDLIEVKVAYMQETSFPNARFDAIALVCSTTHMIHKRQALSEYHRLCRPKAKIYLSESCFRSKKIREEFDARPASDFIRDSIFGWGEMLPLSAYVEFLEDAGFSICSVNDLTGHYARTINDWQANLLKNKDALEKLKAGIIEKFLKYFEIANAAWGYTAKHYGLSAAKRR